jgi:CBS domain-containing protein
MKVKDILRTPYTYFEINDPLKYVAKIFNDRHIASAPVVKEGVLVGIISVSSIVKQFMPKKFLGIWTYDEPAPITFIKNMTVESLLDRNIYYVTPDNDVIDILPLFIDKKYDCIPVVESKDSLRLVGIIRGADIMRIFLKYFATYEVAKTDETKQERLKMETIVGRILAIVEREGAVSAKKISKELNITTETTERIGVELEKHGLIKIRYKFLSPPIFEKVEKFE